MMERNDYIVFVGVPLHNPTHWAKASKIEDDIVHIDGNLKSHVSQIKEYAVAYSNKQIIYTHKVTLPLPKGFTELHPTGLADEDSLILEDIEPGKRHIQVEYGASVSQPEDRNHYSTSLTNVSKEEVKVTRFASYTEINNQWVLNNVTNKFYSDEEYKAWYGVRESGWISPGETVVDKNNYGSPPVLWAYYCETKSGNKFTTGAVLK